MVTIQDEKNTYSAYLLARAVVHGYALLLR